MDLLRQKLDKDSFYPLECYLFKTYKDGSYVYAKKYKHHTKLFKMLSSFKLKAKQMFENWCHRILLSFEYDLKCSCGNTFEFIDFFYPKKKDLDNKTYSPYNPS